jgi:hypothetical protein
MNRLEIMFRESSFFSGGELPLSLIRSTMDYEKKYPITQQPGEYVKVQWERGYKYVELFYKERLIGTVSGAGKLRSGVTLKDDFFNTIHLKLSEKPVTLNLVIDGYHSPVNQSHPQKELKGTAAFFWIISALRLIAGLMEVGSLHDYGFLQLIFLVINLSIITTYILTAVFVGRGMIWAYWMGFLLFCVVFLFHFLVMIISWDFWTILLNFFRGAALGVLIYNLKTAISAGKHAKYGAYSNNDLLDS